MRKGGLAPLTCGRGNYMVGSSRRIVYAHVCHTRLRHRESRGMSALSEALKQANSRGLSTRAIAAEAERRGHRINYSTVSKYMNGTHGEPEEPTLQALAAALQVPLSVLRDAAGLPRDEGPFSLPAEAARLTRRQREAVL